jgi:hypothetical protein
LHVLAALGALVVTDDVVPGGARLGWKRAGGRYLPQLATSLEPEAWASAVAERVRAGAAVASDEARRAAQRGVDKLKAQERKLAKTLKEAIAGAKAEAKRLGARGEEQKTLVKAASAEARQRLEETMRQLEQATFDAAAALGFGPAHLGDVVAVSPALFRSYARRAIGFDGGVGDRAVARQLAALGSDACLENGKVEPTPFSFSNGGSGQALLKDFRALAADCTAGKIAGSLIRGVRDDEPGTNLNWDPGALRSAAYQWSDPSDPRKSPKERAVAANALAYFGLGLVPCFPGRRGLAAVAFDGGFTWPIWEPLLGSEVVAALLAQSLEGPEAEVRRARLAQGILATFRSRLITSDKRYYFAASCAV